MIKSDIASLIETIPIKFEESDSTASLIHVNDETFRIVLRPQNQELPLTKGKQINLVFSHQLFLKYFFKKYITDDIDAIKYFLENEELELKGAEIFKKKQNFGNSGYLLRPELRVV